ncbi:DUF4335 domain-containing protein [Alkalinema sp. FACHB-956]|uniref:DUF4335 domain-containing protein n=1 Tax=Alkalinema sp. FACHB-956 TaxID=2692768 RepID=UPI001685648A|nr:DUF4335 domain-containing protein [Alkalinema sp. FACHB-956]MBD2325872.1 DUF4335 domain-containing protein [Alkalinema sp. FACHB-956]
MMTQAPPNSTVLRKYTPPTCTLEIAAKTSPLSRWIGNTALKNVRFQLSFDDPRVSEDQWVILRGDRVHLEALADVVATYVQNFLNQSSELLPQAIGSGAGLVATIEPLTTTLAAPTNSYGIALQPKGLLAHTLSLGVLANDQSGPEIHLTSTQLADLATALDEYAADVTALPTLNQPAWVQSPAAWGRVAAVALVTVGLSASLLNGLNRSNNNPQTASQPASSSDQRLALQPPPASSPLLSPPGALPPNTTLNPGSPPPPVITSTAPPTGATGTPPGNSPSNVGNGNNPAPGQVIVSQNPPASANARLENVPNAGQAAKQPPQVKEAPVPSLVDQIGSNNATASGDEAAATSQPSVSAARKSAPSAPVLDTSQAEAVEKYVQNRWKPPEGLSEGLEYVLEIYPSGELKSVTPRNEAATTYRDRTGLVEGEPITPASADGKNSTIFLRLEPNGKVSAIKQQP